MSATTFIMLSARFSCRNVVICGQLALVVMLSSGCADKPERLGAGSQLSTTADGSTAFRMRQAETQRLEAMDVELVSLGTALFDAIREHNLAAIQASMLNREVLNSALASTSFATRSDEDRVRRGLEGSVDKLPADLESAMQQLTVLVKRAGIDWKMAEIVEINPHGKRVADELPFEAFKGMHVKFRDKSRPDQTFRLKLGGGVRVNGKWMFIAAWHNLERLDPQMP